MRRRIGAARRRGGGGVDRLLLPVTPCVVRGRQRGCPRRALGRGSGDRAWTLRRPSDHPDSPDLCGPPGPRSRRGPRREGRKAQVFHGDAPPSEPRSAGERQSRERGRGRRRRPSNPRFRDRPSGSLVRSGRRRRSLGVRGPGHVRRADRLGRGSGDRARATQGSAGCCSPSSTGPFPSIS